MKTALKLIAGVLGVILLVVIIGIVLLVTLVNPNHLKPFLAEKVQQSTGRQLIIDGNLSWSLYPTLGIKMGHAELSNPTGFQQKAFAEVDSVTVGVKLLPLFSAKIESNGVSLAGLKLNLIRNADGTSNWQNLAMPSSTKKANKQAAPVETTSVSTVPKSAAAIFISNVDIENATINWTDEKAKQHVTINQLNLSAKDIVLNQLFPVNIQFQFSTTNPKIAGKVDFSAEALIENQGQIYQFKGMNVAAKIDQGNNPYAIKSTAFLEIDLLKQSALLTDWKGSFATIAWTGKLTVKNLQTSPYVSGYLQTKPFVLQDMLAALGKKNVAANANNVTANLNFNFDSAKSAEVLQKISAQGIIKSEDLQLNKLKASNLVAQFQLNGGWLNLSSLSAIFYQGNWQSDAKMNLNNPVLPLMLNAKITNVQAESLGNDLYPEAKLKFSGVGNVDLQLATLGTDSVTMLRNLNGNGKIDVKNGVLKGIDIAYLTNTASALAQGKSSARTNTEQTQFGDLTGTLSIHNGVVSNNDLVLNNPNYLGNGKGTIDLVSQQIDYSLGVKSRQDLENTNRNLANMYGLTIPIKITGNLNHPTVALDTADLTKQAAELQLQRGKEKLKQQITNKIPGPGGQLLQNLLGN